tara:strand:+ start:4 stop:5679 length:5676 start_codon:yes stop_codon:yes gene_type:complete
MLNPGVAYTSSRGVPGGQPQYQSIIYYDPRDRDGYFVSDLERMTPELNERYGVGNWVARPLPNMALSDTYQTVADENEANSYLKQTREKRKELQNEIWPLSKELWNRRRGEEGYNEDDYDPESKEVIELENKIKRLEQKEKELMETLSPLKYSDKDYYYNVNKGAFKLLDDALFENEDHRNYILNEIKKSELDDQKQKYITSVDATNKYFQDIKNLSPTGDIIIMQHGTSKVGPIMYGEQERDHFGYDPTPGVTDTFAEIINENFDDASGITCYMGVCRKSDAGKRLADETNMKVNIASGTQWSGYQTNFGDTFIDRFFGTGVPRTDTNRPIGEILYGYDTYGPLPSQQFGGVLKSMIKKGSRKAVPKISGDDMFQQLKLIADANPISAKKLKLNTDKNIKNLIEYEPDKAQLLINNALLNDDVKFSKINFLDNVKIISENRAKRRFDYETDLGNFGGPGLPGVEFKNVQSFINKLGDDGTTTLFRYGEGPLNTIQPGRGTKFGYYSADPFDVFRYDEMRSGLGPTNVYKIDLDNSLLSKYYKSKDYGKASIFDAATRFTEFEVPDFIINQSNLENLGPINDYRKYLRTLKQSGGELPMNQGGGIVKSITNPLGRLRYKFDPFDVTPKSSLLIPTRNYGDVQHKIGSLINQYQRTDTPMFSNLIIPRSNLEKGDLFATGMGDRIKTFLGEGKMLNEPVKLMDGNTRFWLGEEMGENWDNFYRGLQSDNKNLFPEISKFDLKLDYKSDGQLAWFKPDGTEYTDLVDLKTPFPNLIARDKTSPATLLKGPRKIIDRADLENQFDIRNTGYHTVNIHDGLRNNEVIRSQAKKYGYDPDDDRELAMFLGTSPGGSGRRGGYTLPEGYDILFSGNDPKVTLERYGNMRAKPFTVKFDLLDANVTGPGGTVFFNTDGANKMPVVTPGFNETDLGLYDRISAFDTKNVNFPQFGITNPFVFNTDLGMSTFKKGLDPEKYQGLIVNPNSLQVPGLTQTNLIFGKENVPVRTPRGIFTPDEILKGKKEYGGQTPGLALDDTPDRTYEDGGAVRTSLSKYEDGGEPNYNQMLIKFIKDEEAGMEFMKAKNSAVMKPDGSGYYKRYEDGKFYPYYHQNKDGTYESQATIGYGTKGEDIFDLYKEGMSMPEANEQLTKSLNNAHRKTKIFVDANYGEGFYDNLTDQKKVMLADFTYNLGRLSKYPKFAEGILTDNTDLALAEYIRGEQEGGAELSRNKQYLKIFLQPWVDQTIKKKEIEKQERIQKERDNIMEEKYSSWYSPFVPNSIENLFKQNYDWEDQYFKDKGITTYQDGGQYSNEALSLFSNYQGMLQSSFSEDLRNDVSKTYIDALKREGIDIENMSQGQMFNIARAAQEAGYSMPFQQYDTKFGQTNVPQFMYKGKPFGIEEYDDPVNIFRTKEEFDNILKLAQNIPTSYFTNKDIKNEEDYEKAIFDYFGEEGTVPNQLVSRFLRDVKKAGNIGELSYMQNIPQYNLMRDIMNPEYSEAFQQLLNEKKLVNFFESKEFNRGTKAFKDWEKRYNSNAMNAFETNYLDQMVGNQYSKERKAFDEYIANNPDGGDNELYEAIRTGMQNTAALYNITNAPTTYTTPAGLLGTGESTVDYSTFAEGDVPYYMKDARMAFRNSDGKTYIDSPDFNIYENRPKTRFENSAITKNWDKLGNYLKYDAFHLGPSGGKNMFNLAFGDILYGTVDWALDTAKGVLGVDGDKYEAYERFKENPTPGTFGMLGLDVVSFVPVGKGAKLLKGALNTNKSAKFLTKGISNTPGWQNKTNLLYNNLDDLTNLHSLKKAPPTGPFSSISTGTTFNPQFNLGTFNKPKYTPFKESGFLKTPYQIGIGAGGVGTNVIEQVNPNFLDPNDPNYLKTGLMNQIFPTYFDPLEKNNN